MYKLIIPPKKNEEEVKNEFHELCIKTNHLDEMGNLLPFYNHELFQRLGGNPLCGLLVSSNADSYSMLEIFLKIKKKQNARIPENNISVMLALQISLDYIASESKDVISALRHLSL